MWLWSEEVFRQPVCWWMVLCSYLICCLAWGVPILESIGFWVGTDLGANYLSQMSASHKSSRRWTLTYYPRKSHNHPPSHHKFPEDPPTPVIRSGPDSYEVTAFALGPTAYETLCEHYKSGVSIFPSPVQLLQLSPVGLQSQMLCGGLLLLMPDTRLGSLTWSPKFSLLWEIFCGIIILQFVGHLPRGYGIWLYYECAPPTISLGFLFMFLDVEYIFLVGSNLFYWWLFSS